MHARHRGEEFAALRERVVSPQAFAAADHIRGSIADALFYFSSRPLTIR